MINLKARTRVNSYTICLSLILVSSFFIGCLAYSSLPPDTVLRSIGIVGLAGMIAASGSPADIQATVNAVNSAGGGTVYVPAGTFHWNGQTVTIPAGVNVIGASYAGCMGHESNWQHYAASTILHNDFVPTSGNRGPPSMFRVDGTNGKSRQTRISGIRFEGENPVDHNAEDLSAFGIAPIQVIEAKDFRIDHCTISNFVYDLILVQAGVLWTKTLGHSSYGVIDHCVFDAPYKDIVEPTGQGWYGCYGIVGDGNMRPDLNDGAGNWDASGIRNYAGKYQAFNEVPLVIIEDCHFSRCRHAVDGRDGAMLVARYCLLDHSADELLDPWNAGGELDAHPYWEGQQYPCISIEDYYNTFITDGHLNCQNPGHTGRAHGFNAIKIRGGSALIFGNSYYSPTIPADVGWMNILVWLGDESPANSLGTIRDIYIWDEDGRYVNVYDKDENGDGILDGFISVYGPIGSVPQLNVSFFLRQPSLGQDGWTYTPYPYPHPLVAG